MHNSEEQKPSNGVCTQLFACIIELIYSSGHKKTIFGMVPKKIFDLILSSLLSSLSPHFLLLAAMNINEYVK